MATSKPKITAEQFEALLPKLIGRLTSSLDNELKDCALPELGGKPSSDLWDLPTIDSKTVCKLSPIVQELLGRRLEPSWVRKGGYHSVEAAVKDVIANMKKDCIAGSPLPAPAISPKTVVTA
jgi:hypothetical protein